MEASSPLAAMQAPSFMHWGGGRRDMYTSHPHALSGPAFGPNSFDFREISMKRPSQPDYFTMKPVRGSSPTASLAADLSQNFHIDMRFVCYLTSIWSFTNISSPQLPTPRRSLFTSNLFGTIDLRGKIGRLQGVQEMLTIHRIRYNSSVAIIFSGTVERNDGYLSSATQAAILCTY